MSLGNLPAPMPEEEAKIRPVGGDAFLRKPIAGGEFLAIVRSLLQEDDPGC